MKDQPEERWHGLADHLRAVAARAGVHAGRFGYGSVAAAAGLLHDTGKYSEAFQRRLRGDYAKVDHSGWGARVMRDLIAAEPGGRGASRLPGAQAILYAVAGHHAGLADFEADDGGTQALSERLRGRFEDAGAWTSEIAPPVPDASWRRLPPARSGPTSYAQDDSGFRFAVLTRMIFSCLVDADYADTARFFALAEGLPLPDEGQNAAPLAVLKARVDAYVNGLAAAAADRAAGNAGAIGVVAARATVLADCRAAACQPAGVFSLSVPTGGGKTLASLIFALDHAIDRGMDRVIVVIPYTSIIEQTAEVFRTALGPDLADQVLEHHSAFDTEAEFKRRGIEANAERWQARDKLRRAMERWDRPIIVTTAVQFLESLFSNRPARCRKLQAIPRSVVVMDEAHMMPRGLLRPTIRMLDELAHNYGVSVVLCTATQPVLVAPAPFDPETVDEDAEVEVEALGLEGGFADVREIVADPAALYRRLARVRVVDGGVMDDQALVAGLRAEPQALAIVGTRAHAQRLFQALAAVAPDGVFHLSALMTPAHRSRRLAQIRQALAEGRPCRVVSTTVIECGVDIDLPVVFRAAAGFDSIAQAAGRCNREGRMGMPGQVIVFQPADPADVLKRARPALSAAETARADMVRLGLDDPLSPVAIQRYFHNAFWAAGARLNKCDALDEHNLMTLHKKGAGHLSIPFATIASLYQVIDDDTMPLLIPGTDPEIADRIAALEADDPKALADFGGLGAVARVLQRHAVTIPPRERARLIADYAARVVNEKRYDKQFVVLTNKDIYREDVGLVIGDPTFLSVSSLMPG
ncbi:CRISPR-associated helicase Cas3' [Tistrella bauzanensis]|uniref:CRISPR-associated helicase Cas3' n=1 Tax=Tistrella bauzanensis TaxID=657419 RepID=UPI001E3878AA|nr:CRISPR-associated helicase Cas3' [Tistrella bauzanensis]